ncbi:MAG: hypothetical protein IKZ76_05510 [Lachnospiraceae bacterium]|nr:hypothetical protein [Lachnospiraceae bacterium]MBR5917520.1 hypothetical protein [Lachnospiraceae bacterium]
MLKQISLNENRIPEGVRISEIDFDNPFHDGLHYNPPARGVWNIVHTGMLIPEAHQIYVCAQGCLRGVILTAAEMNRMENMSWVALREQDMWNGEMESRVIEGCSHIVDEMKEHPKCILVYLSCMHLFEGCDFKVIAQELESRYPDIDWVDCYMTPTMRKSFEPDVMMKKSLYSPVKKGKVNDKLVGLIGCDRATDESCEIYSLLAKAGYRMWEITKCKTYEDYLSLGNASLLISYLPVVGYAAKDLTKRLDIPHLPIDLSYDEKEITDNLNQFAESIGLTKEDVKEITDKTKEKAKEALLEAKELIKEKPIAIDATATPRPFGLAKLLCENGFNVTRIYSDAFSKKEKDAFNELCKLNPNLEIFPSMDPTMLLASDENTESDSEYICIGQKAAYFCQSRKFVNIIEGGGMYGFDGIANLCKLMTDAYNNPKDLKLTISHKGLACESCL